MNSTTGIQSPDGSQIPGGFPTPECQQQMIQILGSSLLGVLLIISEGLSLTKRIKSNGIIHAVLCLFIEDEENVDHQHHRNGNCTRDENREELEPLIPDTSDSIEIVVPGDSHKGEPRK